jgi:plasmid stabilization system protein ParE
MAAKLIIAPETALDIDEAYGWYECQRIGLGEDFLTCLDACIQAICRMPEMHPKVHQECRRGLLRRVPYAVFYEYVGDIVTVYCVFHTSQDPDKWRKRLI